MWFWFRLWLGFTRLLPRERRDLILENLTLRHQLAIYQRSHHRPDLAPRDRQLGRLRCTTRHRRPLAPQGLATPLDLEEPAARPRAAMHHERGTRIDPPRGTGESDVGCHPHRG